MVPFGFSCTGRANEWDSCASDSAAVTLQPRLPSQPAAPHNSPAATDQLSSYFYIVSFFFFSEANFPTSVVICLFYVMLLGFAFMGSCSS